MISIEDFIYTAILLGLNFLAFILGSLKRKKKIEYSPLLIIKKPKHIFLNNLIAYIPLVVPIIGVFYLLYIFYNSGRTLGARILLKTYVLLELISASLLAYSSFLLLAYRILDLTVFLTMALVLLALAAYIESREFSGA